MPYVVIEMEMLAARPDRVRALGLYATKHQAEQARRRLHLDNVLKNSWSPPRTFVAEIEGAI